MPDLTRGERRAITTATRRTLHNRFPACFAPRGADKRPLALTVADAVEKACPDLQRTHLRWAIRDYCHGPKYQRNVIAGAARIDLQGQPCGEVTEGQAEYARGRMRFFEKEMAAVRKRRAAAHLASPEHRTAP